MAGRVNTRFVIGLSTALIALIVGLGVVWYLAVRTDPADHIARADGYFAEGQYRKAADNYAKAIARRRQDVNLLLKYAQALSRVQVSTAAQAQDTIAQIINAYRNAQDVAPRSDEVFQPLAELYYHMGRELGDMDAWNQIYKIAANAVYADNTRVLARRYRGIAQVHRLLATDMSVNDRNEAFDDLKQAYQAIKDDPDLEYHLALLLLIEARAQNRPGGDPKLIERHRQDADALQQNLARRFPDDAQVKLYRVHLLGLLERGDQARVLMDELEAHMLRSPDSPRLIIELTQRMTAAPLTMQAAADTSAAPAQDADRYRRAEALLRTAIKVHPDDLRLAVQLGQVLIRLGQTDDAIAVFKQAGEATINAQPLVAFQVAQLKRAARIQYADLRLRQAQDLGVDKAEAQLAEVDKIIGELRTDMGENGYINLLEGKSALIRKQWAEALRVLDRASTQFSDNRPDVLLLSASACVELGELGAAISRLQTLLSLRSDFLPARLELAKLLLRTAQAEKAREHLQAYLAAKPDDYEAQKLMANYQAQIGRYDRAVQAYVALDPKQHPELVPPLARALARSDRGSEALTLLRQRLREAPADLAALRELIQAEKDTRQAQAAVTAARNAGADPKALNLIASRIGDPTGREAQQAVEEYVQGIDDPLQRALSEYRLAMQAGDRAKASAAIRRAATISSDDPQVIDGQFEVAIVEQQWDRAAELAARAKSLNTDLAGGDLFVGRLEMARGRMQLAVSYLKRVVQARPVYSEGWRLLGEAQRRAGDSTGAIESLRRAVEQRPDNVEARRQLATVLDATGERQEALQQLRAAAQFPTAGASIREMYLGYEQRYGEPERALKIRQQLAKVNPSDTDNRRGLAVLYAQMGRTDEAQREMNALFTAEPQVRANYGTYAAILATAGQQEQAKQFLADRVAKLGSRAEAEDWLMLARFCLGLRSFDQAVNAYRKAIAVDPTPQKLAQRELADRLFDLERYEMASEQYQAIWKIDQQDPRVGLRLAESLIRSGQLDPARAVLTELNSKHLGGVNGLLLEAQIARRLGDETRTLQLLSQASELAPDRAVIHYERAVLLAQDPRTHGEAIAALNKTLDLDPNLVAARRVLAQIYLSRNSTSQAVRELQAILARKRDDIQTRYQLLRMYIGTNDLLAAKTLLGESRGLFPRDAQWPRFQAEVAIVEGRTAEAVKYLREAVDIEPNADHLKALGLQLLNLGQAPAALQVISAHPDLVRQDLTLAAVEARALYRTGQTTPALATFQRTLAASRDLEQVVAIATQVIAAMGLDDAARQLEHWANPTNQRWIQLGIARAELGTERAREASSRINRILPQVPDSEMQHYRGLLAMALHNLGELEPAAEQYRLVIGKDPKDFTALNNLAYLMAVDQGRPREALKLAQQAADVAPEDPQVLDTLGWVQFKAGDAEAAEQTLRRSVQIKPLPANAFHLAEVLTARGQERAAADMLTMARRLAEQYKDTVILEQVKRRQTDGTR